MSKCRSRSQFVNGHHIRILFIEYAGKANQYELNLIMRTLNMYKGYIYIVYTFMLHDGFLIVCTTCKLIETTYRQIIMIEIYIDIVENKTKKPN